MSILFYGQIQIQPNQNKIKATKLQEFLADILCIQNYITMRKIFYIYRDIYIKKLRKKNIVHIYIGKF